MAGVDRSIKEDEVLKICKNVLKNAVFNGDTLEITLTLRDGTIKIVPFDEGSNGANGIYSYYNIINEFLDCGKIFLSQEDIDKMNLN